MKRNLLTLALLVLSVIAHAQFVDSFDTNKLGWTEISGSDGDAMIVEGKMHLEGKKSGISIFGSPSFVETHCYAPFDYTKDFEIKCDAFVKKITDSSSFGIILDYIDEGNYIVFLITEKQAALLRFSEYKMVGRIRANIKLKAQKKANLKLGIKSSFQKLEFYINDMKSLECRYLPLHSNGLGFYVSGEQVVEFDELEIHQ